MKLKQIFIYAFCAVIILSSAVIADLSGKWGGSLILPNGARLPMVYIFKVDGNQLTGTVQGPEGTTPMTKGKIDGSDFSFSLIDPDNKSEVIQTGKFYGDSTVINTTMGGMKFHISLTRMK